MLTQLMTVTAPMPTLTRTQPLRPPLAHPLQSVHSAADALSSPWKRCRKRRRNRQLQPHPPQSRVVVVKPVHVARRWLLPRRRNRHQLLLLL